MFKPNTEFGYNLKTFYGYIGFSFDSIDLGTPRIDLFCTTQFDPNETKTVWTDKYCWIACLNVVVFLTVIAFFKTSGTSYVALTSKEIDDSDIFPDDMR